MHSFIAESKTSYCAPMAQKSFDYITPHLNVEVFKPLVTKSQIFDLARKTANFHRFSPRYTTKDVLCTMKGHKLV
jgi:hypothetical protein